MRARLILPIALLAAGCGGEEGEGVNEGASTNQITQLSTPREETEDPAATTRIEPLLQADLERAGLPGAGCSFSHGRDLLLAASASDAIARIRGQLLHFVQSAPAGPSGGFFEDRQVSISVGRSGEAAAAAGEAARWPARLTLTNRRTGEEQEIAGVWTCGARRD